ncbi:hypothetical protein LTS12_000400 [Elasticomyces elasticus]|nr:hypothetical protein LTS12_000400 [Elasticomyces elasticus]
MARDVNDGREKEREKDRVALAHSVFVRLVLPPYTIHFKSPTYMRDSTLDLLDRKVSKETLKSTANSPQVRQAIGTDRQFWSDLVLLFHAAIPSLERRSFTIWDPSSVDYESTSGALIASHYPALWKDLERLNDLVSISRNVLTIGAAAQDLAAYSSLDHEVFRLINCCVRVTARGYDGEAGTGEEEKWQWIVNAYKKLLITSLQFLNNLVAQNERRKLALWMSLFDHDRAGQDEYGAPASLFTPDDIPETSRTSMADVPSNPSACPEPPLGHDDILLAYGLDSTGRFISQEDKYVCLQEYAFPPHIQTIVDTAQSKGDAGVLVGNSYVYFGKKLHAVRSIPAVNPDALTPGEPTLAEEHEELKRQWMDLTESDIDHWDGLYADVEAKYRADLAVWEAKQIMLIDPARLGDAEADAHREEALRERVKELEREIAEHLQLSGREPNATPEGLRKRYQAETGETAETDESAGVEGTTVWEADDERMAALSGVLYKGDLQYRETLPDDEKMLFTAEAGRRILESGKVELLKRLSGWREPEDEEQQQQGGLAVPPPRAGETGRSVSADARVMPVREMNGRAPSLQVRLPEPAGFRDVPVAVPPRGRAPARGLADAVVGATQTLASEEVANGDDQEGSEEGEEEDGEEEEEEGEAEADEEEEEEEEDSEDYPGSTEDGRGLLTDVPLILGPSEIEVLPMLIMSGIVPPPNNSPASANSLSPGNLTAEEIQLETRNAHTIRTHILLSQSTGRNLLRELLIFVAAWDLREEELYFKFMVKILEGILDAGLLPYAYHSFRDRSRSKDIISPAQAVMVKLVTVVYRGRGGVKRPLESGTVADERYWAAKRRAEARRLLGTRAETTEEIDEREAAEGGSKVPTDFHLRRRALLLVYPPPSRTDLHTLNFLFTEFRQHIVPQTCALIFLQSQIHVGRAGPEDFPLNLWDMERMYEGVYQFLEFLAVVCEDSGAGTTPGSTNGVPAITPSTGVGNGWGKAVLAEWEAACELVALLRELEGGSEKRDGIVQLRYGKGAAIGAVSPALAAQRRAMSLQQQQHAASQMPPVMPLPLPGHHQPGLQRSLSADAAIPGGHRQYSLGDATANRPFDMLDSAAPGGGLNVELPPLPTTLLSMREGQSIFEAETPLAYPEDMVLGSTVGGPVHPPPLQPPGQTAPVDQDEPSDFEWRNLKKLTVLVLSSLVWKNQKVQDQVREYGGLEALVSCCRPDENNPYIREHAIMCLRFAVEGNEANAEVMRGLAAKEKRKGKQREETVPLPGGRMTLPSVEDAMDAGGREDVVREVLDAGGYETFLDAKGQVGLRRKVDGAQQVQTYEPAVIGSSAPAAHTTVPERSAHTVPSSTNSGVSKPPPPRLAPAKMTAEKAAELMQNALRDLPLGDKLVTDKQKAEALAKLDRAFESTERALGRANAPGSGAANGKKGTGGGA